MNIREMRQRLATLLDGLQTLLTTAQTENRALTAEEQQQYDDGMAEAQQLRTRIEQAEQFAEMRSFAPASAPAPAPDGGQQRTRAGGAPAVIRTRGDDETRAIAHYIRTGDPSGLGELRDEGEGRTPWGVRLELPSPAEMRANDTTMNITTDADGKYAVPVGLAPRIAARMNERALYNTLGCTFVPGVGTTVNHVFENADPNAFATTSEQADDLSTNNYERDAPVLGNKAFTLVKKTKKLNITEELLEDNDVNLMEFVVNHISRAMANTMNAMLLTEVAANGTQFKLFASNNGIAFGEIDDIVYNDTLGYYLDDGSNAAWVMRPTTYGKIAKITGDDRSYAQTPAGANGRTRRSLLEYPAYYSNNAAAITTSAKSVFFGDWSFVGYRLGPNLRLIQDPYSVDGVLVLKYSFRAVFGVIIAGAIGYGQHPTTTT